MLTEAEVPGEVIGGSRIFHFCTLSMTHEGVRRATRHAVSCARMGGALVSFDPNLRPPLWESLEEARQSVSRLTKGASLEANDRELLSCDSKIIAGVLYEKRKQASLLHIEILAELRSEFRKSPLPETEWVEIIGILLDNAVEASKGGDQIHVRFCKTERSVELTVSNPFPPMSNTEFMRLFGKGVTTKQKEGGMHGYGLYNVLSIMERFRGKVITRNEIRNDRNYVVFGVKMELHRE